MYFIFHIQGEKKEDLFLTKESPNILEAPAYKERIIIKQKYNREILQNLPEDGQFAEYLDLDDEGALLVMEFQEQLQREGFVSLSNEHREVLRDISTSSSLISQFQPFDEDMMIQLKNVLENNQQELLIDINFLQLKEKLMQCCPIMLNRLTQISTLRHSRGKLPLSIRKLYVGVINFCLNYYQHCPTRRSTDYVRRTGGEIKGEWFPAFKLLRQPPLYQADKKNNLMDKEASSCSKLFPEHKKLTAGLFIMTCCCKEKKKLWLQKNGCRRIVKNFV